MEKWTAGPKITATALQFYSLVPGVQKAGTAWTCWRFQGSHSGDSRAAHKEAYAALSRNSWGTPRRRFYGISESNLACGRGPRCISHVHTATPQPWLYSGHVFFSFHNLNISTLHRHIIDTMRGVFCCQSCPLTPKSQRGCLWGHLKILQESRVPFWHPKKGRLF